MHPHPEPRGARQQRVDGESARGIVVGTLEREGLQRAHARPVRPAVPGLRLRLGAGGLRARRPRGRHKRCTVSGLLRSSAGLSEPLKSRRQGMLLLLQII